MVKEDKQITEEIIRTAKLLKEQVDKLCSRGACMWCPLDNIEDCKNYIQLSKMEYHKELDQFN